MLQTARLELRALPAAAAGALPGDRDAAARLVGAALAPDWPQADLLDVLPALAAAPPGGEPFGAWVIVERESATVVGDIGCLGPPAVNRTVEIGYSVIPDRRGRGYATEATRALVARLLAEPGVDAVVARCEPENLPSVRLLERVGFARTDETPRRIHWRLEPS